MWTDNETVDDLLGFQVHVDLIRRLILDSTMLPTTIGIFGDWGGGKTSIMRMLERDLDPANWSHDPAAKAECDDVAVIYLNTWLFEGYDDAKAALLAAILLQLGEHKRFGPRVRDGVVGLLKSVNVMRLLRLGLLRVGVPALAAFASGGATAVSPAIAGALGAVMPATSGESEKLDKPEVGMEDSVNWERLLRHDRASDDPLTVRTFRGRFAKLLKDSNIKALVVLVDDLDRCIPERIIETLEAIKLFLNVERTAFVIGADPRIVEHAIRTRYAQIAIGGPVALQMEQLVRDYLEKVIQIPYRLPRLSASEIETYMTLLFCQRYLPANDATICVRTCAQLRAQNRFATFGYAAVIDALKRRDLPPELSEALTFSAAVSPLIADGLKGNPRQVKRFMNALLLRKQLAAVAHLRHVQDSVLVKLMILEYTDAGLFSTLFEWQARQNGHPAELASLEELAQRATDDAAFREEADKVSAGWGSTRLRKWLSMEPLLANIDLRDYFWIARDRLQSTLVGASLVSPAVRQVVEALLADHPAKRHPALATALSFGDDDRAAMYGLIEQRIAREPSSPAGFDALIHLSRKGVPGAARALASAVVARPASVILPAVALDIQTLAGEDAALRRELEPALKHLEASASRAGIALRGGTRQ